MSSRGALIDWSSSRNGWPLCKRQGSQVLHSQIQMRWYQQCAMHFRFDIVMVHQNLPEHLISSIINCEPHLEMHKSQLTYMACSFAALSSPGTEMPRADSNFESWIICLMTLWIIKYLDSNLLQDIRGLLICNWTRGILIKLEARPWSILSNMIYTYCNRLCPNQWRHIPIQWNLDSLRGCKLVGYNHQ